MSNATYAASETSTLSVSRIGKDEREAAASRAVEVARKHQHLGDMSSSARLCVEDAEGTFDQGFFDTAHARALRSLSYSVGVFHAAYKEIASTPYALMLRNAPYPRY